MTDQPSDAGDEEPPDDYFWALWEERRDGEAADYLENYVNWAAPLRAARALANHPGVSRVACRIRCPRRHLVADVVTLPVTGPVLRPTRGGEPLALAQFPELLHDVVASCRCGAWRIPCAAVAAHVQERRRGDFVLDSGDRGSPPNRPPA